jgi:hypothetical protein
MLVTANVVPSSLTLFTVMMEVIRSSETSVPTRVTPRYIPEDTSIIQSPGSRKVYSFPQYSSLSAVTLSISVICGVLFSVTTYF